MRTLTAAGVGALCLSALSAGCVLDAESIGATGSFERSLTVAGPVDLHVRTGSGAIHIHTGSAGSVRVVGRIRANGSYWSGLTAEEQVKELQSDPPIDQDGNRVDIGNSPGFGFFTVAISYDLTVPPGTSIRARTGSGSIQGESISGSIEAQTGSGSINVEQTGRGDVEVAAGSGSIQLTGIRGALRARAGSGEIRVDGEPVHDWFLKTGSGSITVHVPADAAFDLSARTGSGDIHSSHVLEATGDVRPKRLDATVRGGGARLEARTGSGSIEID